MSDSFACPPRVHVRTLGCKVNQVDSDEMCASLSDRGARIVADPEEAEFIVVNTCSVTAESDKKCRKAIRHLARLPHAPRVIVTGCMAAIDAEAAQILHESVTVVPDRRAVATVLLACLAPRQKSSCESRRGGLSQPRYGRAPR